jgi:hypothetical protein
MTQSGARPEIEKLLGAFRASREGRILVPMEASFSLPVPFKKGGANFLSVFTYASLRDASDAHLVLKAPWSCLTITHPGGALARYEDFTKIAPLAGRTPAAGTPIGVFPHPTVAGLSVKEYTARRRQLLQETDGLIASGVVSDAYRRLWCLLMEPAFAPFYWHMAPRFLREILAPSKPPQEASDATG